MSSRVRVKPAWRQAFLRNVRQGKPLTIAAQAANVGLERVHQEKRRDPGFVDEWNEARDKAPKHKGSLRY